MAGYDELKIEVGFKLEDGVGSDIERQLAALSNAKDFKIETKIDIKDDQVKSLEKLEKVLSKLNGTTAADINKFKSIGDVFSSIRIDDTVINNIEKVQKSLESFGKLSVDLQRRLAKGSMFEATEKDVKGVTMQMEEFDKQVQKTLKNIQGEVKGSTESLTGYINSQAGTVKVLVEQLNDVYKVTKNIDGNGNIVGKVSGNVSAYVDNIGSLMKQNYTKLLKYQGDYYKAVADQDKDMVYALEQVMDFYQNQNKMLNKSLDDNGLREFARDRIKEIEDIHALNSKLSDLKGVNLLDKENLKSDEKALSSFIKQYDDVVKDLKKYEPQLLTSEHKGNEADAKFLREKVEALRNQKVAMEEMIPSFRQWDKALAEFEKRDSQLQDKIKQKVAQLDDQDTKKRKEEIEKDETSKYKRVLGEYKQLTNELKALGNEQAKAIKNGEDATFKKVSKEIGDLELKRTALKDTVKELKEYEKAQKEINEIDSKFNRDTGIKDAKAQDRIEKEKYSNLLSNYKDVTDQLHKLAKQQRVDLDKGDKLSFSESTEQIKALDRKKKALLDNMKTLKEYGKISQEVAKIDRTNRDNLKLVDAGRQDASLKRAEEDVKKLAQSYEKLGKAIKENLGKATSMKDSSLLKDTNIDKVYNDLLRISNIKFDNLGKADIDNLIAKVERLGRTVKQFETAMSSNKKFQLNDLKVDKLESEFRSLENQIRRALGNSHADKLIGDLNQLRSAASKSADEFDIMAKKYENSMNDAKKAIKSFGADINSGGGFFNDFYDNLFTFTAGELLADGIRNVGYAVKDMVMEYDHAMTNLKKVANPEDIMNQSQLDSIKQRAVGIAKDVGMASQDVIQAIADTIQMSGKSMEESIVIAEQTMMLANVAEMTQESASEAVVSMMAAFNLDPLKEVPVVVNGVTKSTTELTNAMDMVNHVG